MDQQQVTAVANRFINELHRLEEGDPAGADRLAEMFADNAELTNPLIERNGGTRHGRDEIAAFWREYSATFGDVHSDFFHLTASDHSAGLFWRSNGTGPFGQPIHYEGVSLLVLDDAVKISHFQGFFDTRQMTVKESEH